MRVLSSGNWAKDWKECEGVSSTSYYRKHDIERELQRYGHTGHELPDAMLDSNQDAFAHPDLNTAAYLVEILVEPFRTVYHCPEL